MSGAGRVHIIGAGLGGLSAAVRLTEAGRQVTLYEAGAQAGGRCRSYVDEVLGCRIDNGNHLLLSGNNRALAYLATIGAGDSLAGPQGAVFPFFDLMTNERWTVRPNRGPLPYWLLDPRRRVLDSRLGDYPSALKLAFAKPTDTVAALFAAKPLLYRRFWAPLAVSVLNTPPNEAAARLLGADGNAAAGGVEMGLAKQALIDEINAQPAEPWWRNQARLAGAAAMR